MNTTALTTNSSRSTNTELISQIVGIGLPALTLLPWNQSLVDEYLRERNSRPLMIEVRSPSASAQSTHVVQFSDVDARLLSTMASVFEKLAQSQKDLDPDSQKVLYENLWNLY
jgi:hypothetical protein